MAGELLIEEKIAMTVQALRTLRAQLFERELQGIANTEAFRANRTAKAQQLEQERALKHAILQLEQKHDDLVKEKATLEQSSPSSPSPLPAAPEHNSGPARSGLPRLHSQSRKPATP
jgi:hypothetical protein